MIIEAEAKPGDDFARLQEMEAIRNASLAPGTKMGHWGILGDWEERNPTRDAQASYAKKPLLRTSGDKQVSLTASWGGRAQDTYCKMT